MRKSPSRNLSTPFKHGGGFFLHDREISSYGLVGVVPGT
jgi:hypothetical protein